MQSLTAIYAERQARFQNRATALAQRYNRLGLVRLLLFFVGVAILILLWSLVAPWATLLGAFLFLWAFARFVFWHQNIQKARLHHEHLAAINALEQQVLAHDYTAIEDGEVFVNPQHPYSVDMDIFGPYSFFQYSNRTVTAIGKKRYAEYLEKGVATSEILQRQAAISELKNRIDWRQNFQAKGMGTTDSYAYVEALRSWITQPHGILGNRNIEAARYWVPLLSIVGLVLSVFYLPWQVGLLFFLPAGYYLKKTLEHINKTAHQTGQAAKVLAYYGALIAQIETTTFESQKLQNIQSTFVTKTGNASKQVQQLSHLIGQLNVRNNMFAIFLNLLGLWDIQYTYLLEKWKERHRHQLPAWFDKLAELEALLSLATVFYNNPDWVLPTISEQDLVQGTAVGHPLIAPSKRVCNDIRIPTKGHIKLVTGSNMAGKSTLLRTVGLNIILANIGSAVCAKTFTTPLLQVYSSMRTQDALHESTSSFYAELKRLKFIIEAVERQENIFFLMDEILKGTNSNDRHIGSKALIKQLIKGKGAGIIATHDLELGILEAQYGGAIENWCMEVEVRSGELIFDYKLKKGVSQSFNATQLMKNMGIRIED